MLIGHDAMPAIPIYAVATCLVDFLIPLYTFHSNPGPALATCLPISYSLVTGLPITADLILPKKDILRLTASNFPPLAVVTAVNQGVPRKILECGLLESTANPTYVFLLYDRYQKKHRFV